MKLVRVIFLFLMICLCAGSAMAAPEGDFTYEVFYNEAWITGYGGNLKELVIPSELNGYPVTRIAAGAFQDCNSLESVFVPDCVTEIGSYAFGGCINLVSIRLSDELTSISDSLFSDCKALTTIDLPDELTSIGGNAFWGCSSLSEMCIPESVKSIGNGVFLDCVSLTSIDIPEGIMDIGQYMFFGCEKLESVTIPSSVTSIGAHSFMCCEQIKRIELPDGIISIGEDAFRQCSSLVSINIPESVKDIGNNAFFVCESLLKISLPEGITSIGEWTFGSCSNLTSIELPTSLKSIGECAFYCCESLERIDIPNGVLDIGVSAFEGCTGFTSIRIPVSMINIDERVFSNCDRLVAVEIPDGIISIGNSAFSGCEDLTSIVLSSNITSIDDTALPNNLRTVYTYKNSYAAKWAKEHGKTVVYLDNTDIEDYMAISGPRTAAFDAGDVYEWKKDYVLLPVPFEGGYTMEITSSNNSIASVEDDTVYFHNIGDVTLTVTVKELDWLSWPVKVTVYNPTESFDLPTAIFSKVGTDSFRITPKNIVPEKTNPVFDWIERGDGWHRREEGEQFWIIPGNEISVTQLNVAAKSGVMRNCLLVTYEEAGMTRFEAFSEKICPGMTVTPVVIAYVDNVPYVSEPALYTLTSSDTKVVKPTGDGKLLALKAGTAIITAKNMLTDENVKQTITVSDERIYILPESTVMISREAFAISPATIVVIPDGCEIIAERAFADCTDLKRVEIPASVTSIAEDAFSGCPDALVIIAPEGSTAAEFAQVHGFIE